MTRNFSVFILKILSHQVTKCINQKTFNLIKIYKFIKRFESLNNKNINQKLKKIKVTKSQNKEKNNEFLSIFTSSKHNSSTTQNVKKSLQK